VNNDTNHAENLEFNNKPIEFLYNNKSYKYLGIHINLRLNWEDQREILENKYKNSVRNHFQKILFEQ